MDYTGKDIIEMLEITIEELKKHDVHIDAYFNKDSDFTDIRDIFNDVKKHASLLDRNLRIALNGSYLEYVNNLNITNKLEEQSGKSTIYNNEDLLKELQRLNPGVDIEYDESLPTKKIVCSKNIDELKLPVGFYYNEKNGLTNKHNTISGMYVSVKFETKSLSMDEIEDMINDFNNRKDNKNVSMSGDSQKKYVDAGNKKSYSLKRDNKFEKKETKSWKKVLIIMTVAAMTLSVGISLAEKNMNEKMFGSDSISTSQSTPIEEPTIDEEPIVIPNANGMSETEKNFLPSYTFTLEKNQDIEKMAKDILRSDELLNKIYNGNARALANAIISQKPGANISKYPYGEYYFRLGKSDTAIKYLEEHPDVKEALLSDYYASMDEIFNSSGAKTIK